MSIYVIDYGSTHITSAQDFATLPEAEDWQVEVLLHDPTVGVLLTLDAFLLTPSGASFDLDIARSNKLSELRAEALVRTSEGISSIAVLEAIAQVSALSSPTSAAGLTDERVLIAYLLAIIAIVALPTAAAVDAYDVVNDPSWPVAPVLTTNLANIQAFQEESGLVTALTNGVWTIIDVLLEQNGTSDNMLLAISQISYTGEIDQEIVASLAINGVSDATDMQEYRVGFSVNGADPVRSFGLTSEKDDGLCTASVAVVLPIVQQGDTIVPMIINTGSDTDFVLGDMFVTIGRWTT